MSNEIKISIIILLLGGSAAAFYWYGTGIPQFADKLLAIEEAVILPQHPAATYQQITVVQSYLDDLHTVIRNGQSILPLQVEELDENGQEVQDILLGDARFLQGTVRDGKPLHNDIMSIRPVIVSVLNPQEQTVCNAHTCYQAEKYNFVTNTTTRAIIDFDDKTVFSVTHYPDTQPDISLRLTRIAQQIALNAPEIKKQLNAIPTVKDMTMANVRAALNKSPCDNSAHLCVAPTFADHQNQQALWAIVDLTDLKLVAAKWTALGKTTIPASISERSLQNWVIMKNYCQKNTVLEKNGWKLDYRLTGSDGLEIRNVFFNRKSVFRSAKTVDWHVSYKQKKGVILDTAQQTYIAGRQVEYEKDEDGNYSFGYNDAMGCPMFSTSVVLPFNQPQIRELTGNNTNEAGFSLTQDFRNPKWPMACNYRYENRFEFYDDGSFRVVSVNIGRGCGDNAIYRPVMRVDMAIDEEEVFYQYNQKQWDLWTQEQHNFQSKRSSYYQNQYRYKLTAKNNDQNGYYIEPERNQSKVLGRDDNAVVFVTVFKPEEGDQDLLTLGSCCNLKLDGVERYLTPVEKIDGKNLVIWYVPRIQNETSLGNEYCWADTAIGDNGNLEVKEWPCEAGLKFTPVSIDQP